MNRPLFAIIALACAIVLTALTVHAETPTLVERLVQAQRLPGVRHAKEPVVDERELASVIASASKGNRTLAALMLTTASAESGLRQRIAEGRCKVEIGECDRGKSVGLWQTRALEQGAELRAQAETAARELTRATRECSGRAPFPLGSFRSYGSGKGCFGAVPRETERTELFKRIARVVR